MNDGEYLVNMEPVDSEAHYFLTVKQQRLRRLFFPAYFCLSPQQKHVRKVVGGFGKKSCVSTGVRKPGNTYASLTAMT